MPQKQILHLCASFSFKSFLKWGNKQVLIWWHDGSKCQVTLTIWYFNHHPHQYIAFVSAGNQLTILWMSYRWCVELMLADKQLQYPPDFSHIQWFMVPYCARVQWLTFDPTSRLLARSLFTWDSAMSALSSASSSSCWIFRNFVRLLLACSSCRTVSQLFYLHIFYLTFIFFLNTDIIWYQIN